MKYYVQENAADAKKKLERHCKHLSLIREIKQPSGEFGDITVLRPSKVEEALTKRPYTQGWYQGTVNLAEQGLVGPFNFLIDPPGQFFINQAVWKALEDTDKVNAGRVDIDDLNRMNHATSMEKRRATRAVDQKTESKTKQIKAECCFLGCFY